MPDEQRHISYQFLGEKDWYGYGIFDIDEDVTDRLQNAIKWAFRTKDTVKVTIEYEDGSGYTFRPTETIEDTEHIRAINWKV